MGTGFFYGLPLASLCFIMYAERSRQVFTVLRLLPCCTSDAVYVCNTAAVERAQWTRNLSCVLGAGESSQYLASDLTPDLTLAFPLRLLVSTSTAGSLKARAQGHP